MNLKSLNLIETFFRLISNASEKDAFLSPLFFSHFYDGVDVYLFIFLVALPILSNVITCLTETPNLRCDRTGFRIFECRQF